MSAERSSTRARKNTYEMLTVRVQKIITSHEAQRTQQAIIGMLPGESADDWDRLISEISYLEGVSITLLPDSSAKLTWGSNLTNLKK